MMETSFSHFSLTGPVFGVHYTRRLDALPVPVVIQQSADPDLDRARRATIIEYLADQGVTNAGERVQIGMPEAEGLFGFEAPRTVRGYARGIGLGGGGSSFVSGSGRTGGGTGGLGGGGMNVGGFF